LLALVSLATFLKPYIFINFLVPFLNLLSNCLCVLVFSSLS
jgi:hypothetical protein